MTPRNPSQARLLALRVEIETLLTRLGYTLVIGKGDFRDGACVVQQDRKIVINQYTPLDLQIDFLAATLRLLDLSNVYILPAIRELIENG